MAQPAPAPLQGPYSSSPESPSPLPRGVRAASRTFRIHSKIYTCPLKKIDYGGRKLFRQEEIHILSTEVLLFLLILRFQK